MTTNKKITLAIIILAIIIVIFGIVKGKKQYKEYNYTADTAQTTGTSSANPTDKCIITIQGGHYDVTEFRSKHEGGDVFKCGEDMTAAFQGKHKGYLPMIAKFKVD